jgi:y4mF family transcriptional regulator
VNDRASSDAPDERGAALAVVVRRRRRALGLRQAEVAELADCSTRFVHMVEQGKPTIRLDKLLDVLGVLGLGLTVRPGHGEIEGASEAS